MYKCIQNFMRSCWFQQQECDFSFSIFSFVYCRVCFLSVTLPPSQRAISVCKLSPAFTESRCSYANHVAVHSPGFNQSRNKHNCFFALQRLSDGAIVFKCFSLVIFHCFSPLQLPQLSAYTHVNFCLHSTLVWEGRVQLCVHCAISCC